MSDTPPVLNTTVAGHVRAAAGASPDSATDYKFWFGLSRSEIGRASCRERV